MDFIVVAAGNGSRFGGDIPKQFVNISGFPLIYYTLWVLQKSNYVRNIIVVVSENHFEYFEKIRKKYLKNITKLKNVVIGGKRRQDSVFQGLKAISNCDYVAIHDSARPFITFDIIERLYISVKEYGGVCPSIDPVDTIKIVDSNNIIVENLKRESLKLIQTPQVFSYNKLFENYKYVMESGINVTDDSEIFCINNGKVKLIDGYNELFKITYKSDIEIAKKIISNFKSKGYYG